MSFQMTTYIDDVEVRPGALIANRIVSSDRVFGRVINHGARCESVSPDSWVPVVRNGSIILWEGDPQPSYEAAAGLALRRVERALDDAVEQLFR